MLSSCRQKFLIFFSFLHFFQYSTNFLLSRLKHKTNFHIILSFMLQWCSWKNKPENIFVFIYRVFYFSMDVCKDVHIVVPFAYLLSSYSKFEWAQNAVVQAHTKKLSGKQIYRTTKWFLWKLDNLSHLYYENASR